MFPTKNLHNFGAGGATVLSPYVIVAMIVAALLIVVLPRRYVIWAYLIPITVIPLGQVLMVGSLHLPVLRILTLIAVSRAFMNRPKPGEPGHTGWTKIDRWFTAWAVVSSGIFIVRWHTFPAAINQVAGLIDTLGIYFTLRFLIRDKEDVLRTIRVFAVICCLIAIPMLQEHASGRNPWSILGGVPELSQVRNGRVRAQGPFLQEILAGAFGATLIALFVGLWSERSKSVAAIGICGATVMALTCASSTPLMCVAGAVITFMIWPLRRQMRLIRTGIVASLIGLQLMMKAPVWFLMADVDLAGGSTGWDRAKLIDTFFHHFFDWFLIGTNSNGNWGYNMFDLCDAYVNEAARGGLLGVVLFVGLIVVCFKSLGQTRRALEGNTREEFFVWAIAAALFSHVLGYFGIAYFDQTMVVWFALLAMISAMEMIAVSVEEPLLEVVPALPWRQESVPFHTDSKQPIASYWKRSTQRAESTGIPLAAPRRGPR